MTIYNTHTVFSPQCLVTTVACASLHLHQESYPTPRGTENVQRENTDVWHSIQPIAKGIIRKLNTQYHAVMHTCPAKSYVIKVTGACLSLERPRRRCGSFRVHSTRSTPFVDACCLLACPPRSRISRLVLPRFS